MLMETEKVPSNDQCQVICKGKDQRTPVHVSSGSRQRAIIVCLVIICMTWFSLSLQAGYDETDRICPFYHTSMHQNAVEEPNGTAQEKLDTMWKEIKRLDHGKHLPWPGPIAWAKFLWQNMAVTFDATGDTMPPGRHKSIHSQGIVAKARIVVPPLTQQQHNLTGIFRYGAPSCLIRLSLAIEPSARRLPGLAIKMFRDGERPSTNTVVMPGLMGQSSWNFFKSNYSNHLEMPTGLPGLAAKPMIWRFRTASPYVNRVGLSEMAEERGMAKETTSFPWQLHVVPTERVKSRFTDTCPSPERWDDHLVARLSVSPGESLFHMYATLHPADTQREERRVYIGDLRLQDGGDGGIWVKGGFGDEMLWFRHVRMDEDIALQPSWERYARADV